MVHLSAAKDVLKFSLLKHCLTEIPMGLWVCFIFLCDIWQQSNLQVLDTDATGDLQAQKVQRIKTSSALSFFPLTLKLSGCTSDWRTGHRYACAPGFLLSFPLLMCYKDRYFTEKGLLPAINTDKLQVLLCVAQILLSIPFLHDRFERVFSVSTYCWKGRQSTGISTGL